MRVPNWVAERLGASSRSPRHPFSALMAEVNPGPVPVHRALPSHLEQATRNLLDLPNRDVDHLVNELQMRKLYGLHEQTRPREPASAPRHGCRRHKGDEHDATEGSRLSPPQPAPVELAQPAQQGRENLVELQLCNLHGQRTMGIGLRTTTGMRTTTSGNCPSGSYRP